MNILSSSASHTSVFSATPSSLGSPTTAGGFSSEPVGTPKKSRGCFFYGCFGALILSVIAVLVLVFGAYFGTRYLASYLVDNYTSPSPLALPPMVAENVNYAALETRVAEFVQGLNSETGPKQLTLTSDELNTLVNQHPDLAHLRNSVRVSIKENELHGQVSYPLDAFGYPGRFFNGEGSVEVAMANGILEASVKSLEVRGEAVPQLIIDDLNKENLAAKLYQGKESLEILKKIERIQLGEGSLVIQRR